MAQFQIKNLGAVGVVADIAATDLPPNGFTNANNARFVDGRVLKIGGNAPSSFVEDDKSIVPLSILPMPFDFFSGGNSFNIVGTADSLYKLDNNALTRINKFTPYRTTSATSSITVTPVVAGISITDSFIQIKLGEEYEVVATITPEGVRNVTTEWSVSNESYATITPNPDDPLRATVKANGTYTGNVTVRVETGTDGEFWDTVVVNIAPNVDSIYLDKSQLQIRNGDSNTLTVAFNPANPADQAVTWVSSDLSVATFTINPNNPLQVTVNTLRRGTCTISCFLTSTPTLRATCPVQVISAVDYIFLDRTQLITNTNTTTDTLTVGYYPATTNKKGVVWTVPIGSDVVQVIGTGDTVQLRYLKVGVAQILVTANEGGSTATCDITVRAEGITTASTVSTMSLMARSLFAVAAVQETVTSVSIDKPNLALDVGDTDTLTAVVVPAGIENLQYKWAINRAGFVSYTTTNKNTLDITAIKPGNVTVTVSVYDTRQEDYSATPDTTWYHTVISNCAVATCSRHIPQVKEFDSQYFTDLPGWGEQTEVDDAGNISVKTYSWFAERLRAFNNRLFALNTTEVNSSGASTHFPLRLRWSNFADENAAPFLWDDLADLRDPDSNTDTEGTIEALQNGYAGYIDLADSNGGLIDMLPLKDYLFVYTEFETYVGTPTMNAYQPFQFKKLFNDSGILAPECVTEVEGSHFVVTQNDIILHNGATKKSIASNRVKNKVIDEISSINPAATQVHLHSDKKEVWILYVAPGSAKESWACNKAAVWNYEFDTWSFCDIPYSYDIALIDPPVLEKSATWEDLAEYTWDSDFAKITPWQKNVSNFHQRITVVGSAAKGFYQVDIGAYNHQWNPDDPDVVTQVPLKMWTERFGIDFDNLTDEWNQKHVNVFNPQVTGRGTIQFTAGGTQYSNEKGHNHSTRDYTAGKTRQVNVRLNHPYLYYEIYDEDPDSTIAVNSLIIEYAVGGRR